MPAREKWRSIIKLYGDNKEFQPQVEYARKRVANEEVEPFDFGEPEHTGDGQMQELPQREDDSRDGT